MSQSKKDGGGGKKNKAYYIQQAKRQKEKHLEPGMKGFLVTCNNREREAVREAYSILNEHADILYGPEKKDSDADKGEEDIAASLAQELDDMKKTPSTERRFLAARTGTKSCIFIKTTLENPDFVTNHILEEVAATKKVKSRYILRFWPVLGTCKAAEDKIESLAYEILPRFLTGQEKAPSYSIDIKRRNNKNLDRFTLIRTVGRVVEDINSGCMVDLSFPDIVISLDILTTFCCVGVLRNFRKWKKYNVQEMVAVEESPSDSASAESPVKRKHPDASADDETEVKVPKLDVEGEKVVDEAEVKVPKLDVEVKEVVEKAEVKVPKLDVEGEKVSDETAHHEPTETRASDVEQANNEGVGDENTKEESPQADQAQELSVTTE